MIEWIYFIGMVLFMLTLCANSLYENKQLTLADLASAWFFGAMWPIVIGLLLVYLADDKKKLILIKQEWLNKWFKK